MNRQLSGVAAFIVAGAVTSSASAANSVWFQPSGPPAQTGSVVCASGPGSPGAALSLSYDASGGSGSCTWPVRLMLDYQGDGNDSGIYAWALDLYTDALPTKLSAAFGSYQSTSAFASANEYPPTPPHPNGYDPLLTGRGRVRTDGLSNPFGLYALMDFTITKSLQQNDMHASGIYVRIGNGGWGVEDPTFVQYYGQYSFGPNPATFENGAPGTVIGFAAGRFAGGAVIVINGVPEPSALSLNALGALALIRRR